MIQIITVSYADMLPRMQPTYASNLLCISYLELTMAKNSIVNSAAIIAFYAGNTFYTEKR